ncbi:MAG: hypothetical protein QOH41_4489 [Blastocatellia bacterium]|jgi:hypothetical protein|nr:hypothetical protein [Blastocatellia bacterium]
MCAGVLVATLLASPACGGKGATYVSNQSNAAQSANALGELHYKAPDGWVKEQTTSKMRVAQYTLPKTEGDPADASLVLYYFGATQGGAVQANIDRWVNQMQQRDGSASKDKAKTETSTVNGLKVTSVDVSGTYTAEMAPGSGSAHNDANYRMRAAVIETPKGNYFLKLVGPAKTMSHWDQSVTDFVKSFEFK